MYKISYLGIFLFVLASFIPAQNKVFTFTKDAGVVSLDTVKAGQSNAVMPKAIVKNFGTSAQTFQVQLKIGNYYLSTREISNLQPDSTVQVFFDNLWTIEKGYYDLVCYTMLNGDENHSNDTIVRYLSYGQWTSLAQTPAPRKGVGEAIHNDGDSTYGYDIGGTFSQLGEKSTYRYNFERDSWVKLADMPYPVLRHTASKVGNKIYVIGGEEMDIINPNIYDTISVYNIDSNSWSIASFKMPAKILDATADVYADSLIYIINGTCFPSYIQLSYVVYPKGNLIKSVSNCPGSHAAVVNWNNRLICFSDSGIYSAAINPLHPENISWIKKLSLNTQNGSYFSAKIWGDKIICLSLNLLFVYDPVNNIVSNLQLPSDMHPNGGYLSWVRGKNGQREYMIFSHDTQYKYTEVEPVSAVDNEQKMSPVDYILCQNYPNPFNPATKIKFNLPVQSNVKIRVYDMLGREVALLANNLYSAGEHEVNFDGAMLSSGVYVYRIEAAGINGKTFNAIKKMVLLK